MKNKEKDMWFHSIESPSQRKSEFGEFFLNREQLISDIVTRNFFCVLITRYLNVRTTNW